MGLVRGLLGVGVLGALGYGLWTGFGGAGMDGIDALANGVRFAFVNRFDPTDLQGTASWWEQQREDVIAAAQSGNLPRLEAVTQDVDAAVAAIPRGELQWAMEVLLVTRDEVVVTAWVPCEDGMIPLVAPSSVVVATSPRQVEKFLEMPLAGPPAMALRIGRDISREFALGLQRGDWIETAATIRDVVTKATPLGAMHLVVVVKDVTCR